MNDSVRTWPALDISPVSELLQAALVDYDVCAVDERSSDEWRVFFNSGGERDRAAGGLRIELPDLAIESVDVPDENWAARSQASLRAVRVGNIVVAPPWDLSSEAAGLIRIVIQPSMGFGTGHHATTRLCLAALQRLELHGRSVVDVGTGSGVLAIAASLLGAAQVVGIDDDADAIASAQESLDLNANAHVTLAVADLRSTPLAPVDVVVANLTGGLLTMAAPILQGMATQRGQLVLSGLMVSEELGVLTAFPNWNLEHRADEDEWVCLTLREGARR